MDDVVVPEENVLPHVIGLKGMFISVVTEGGRYEYRMIQNWAIMRFKKISI